MRRLQGHQLTPGAGRGVASWLLPQGLSLLSPDPGSRRRSRSTQAGSHRPGGPVLLKASPSSSPFPRLQRKTRTSRISSAGAWREAAGGFGLFLPRPLGLCQGHQVTSSAGPESAGDCVSREARLRAGAALPGPGAQVSPLGAQQSCLREPGSMSQGRKMGSTGEERAAMAPRLEPSLISSCRSAFAVTCAFF